ncbi:hypothetical protein BD626DRAFT_568409 [Schizophyllum amplum]|uniref:F-box domain-containing protein n=1 Tax=Schizophyllum amplum TaxID=97359 RepID=A0A550CG45_9AGAR|nr:hypothetical protein BD626DRAFT_568409 [Auriculariopsis ampla]
MYRNGNPYAIPSTIRDRLAEFNASIEREEEKLGLLVAQLQDVLLRAQRQRSLNNALLSSIRRLPPEVLSEIFLHAAADQRKMDLTKPGHHYHFARVCHLWRFVALTTPALWTDVSVKTVETPNIHNLFAHEFPLAGEYPLRVRLEHPAWHAKLDEGRATRSWDLLLQQSHRWQTLDLALDYHVFCGMTPQPVSCISLETLSSSLGVVDLERLTGSSAEVPSIFSSLADAPRLRRVELITGLIPGTHSLRFPASWRLSHLVLEVKACGSLARLLSLIRQLAPTLRTFSLDIIRAMATFLPPPLNEDVRFPKLVEFTCFRGACFLFQHIAAPKLSSLSIGRHPVPLSSYGAAPLDSIAGRIGMCANLLELLIIDVIWPAESSLDTLRCLENLTSLDLREKKDEYVGRYINNELFVGLTRGGVEVEGVVTGPNPACPLPRLERMRVVLYKDSEERPGLIAALRTMALSRRNVEEDGGDPVLIPLRKFSSSRYRQGTTEKKTILSWDD